MNALSPDEILEARSVLAGLDPALAIVHQATPAFAWRRRPLGFEGLLRLLIEQQISVAAAAAIWARLEAGLVTIHPDGVLITEDADLRSFGFSASKIRHARALAEATLNGSIDFEALRHRSDEEALAALTALSGVGPWTAQVYLMMCEGRPDVFPVGDLALKEAVRLLDREAVRLTDQALHARAVRWRPHRGVAAHMLWAYYLAVKAGEFEPPSGVPRRLKGGEAATVLEAPQKSFKKAKQS